MNDWLTKPAYKMILDLVKKPKPSPAEEPQLILPGLPNMKDWMDYEYGPCQCGSGFVQGYENCHSLWCPKYKKGETK